MKYKFNFSTVTDRDHLFSKRCLRAASARFDAENLERFFSDAEELVHVRDARVVGEEPEIKVLLRQLQLSGGKRQRVRSLLRMLTWRG